MFLPFLLATCALSILWSVAVWLDIKAAKTDAAGFVVYLAWVITVGWMIGAEIFEIELFPGGIPLPSGCVRARKGHG